MVVVKALRKLALPFLEPLLEQAPLGISELILLCFCYFRLFVYPRSLLRTHILPVLLSLLLVLCLLGAFTSPLFAPVIVDGRELQHELVRPLLNEICIQLKLFKYALVFFVVLNLAVFFSLVRLSIASLQQYLLFLLVV